MRPARPLAERRPKRAQISAEQLASLSHEFRTPLNGVLGMSRLLESTRLTAEQRAVVLGLLKSAPEVTRVTFLFTEFIGPSRILLAAHVGISGERSQAELAYTLRALEQGIMANKHVGQAILTLATPQEEDL